MMAKLFLIATFSFLIYGCSISASKEKIQSDKEMAIWNDPNIPEDTKREMLNAMYLERTKNHKTEHDPSEYRPVVDPKICSDCPFEKDFAACRNVASQSTNYAGGTLGWAAVGAGIGAALAAVSGLDVGIVAAGGATGGAIGGLGRESLTHNQMIARCMQGRGYNVLR